MINDKITKIMNDNSNTKNGKYWLLIQLKDKLNRRKITKSNTKGLKQFNIDMNRLNIALKMIKD